MAAPGCASHDEGAAVDAGLRDASGDGVASILDLGDAATPCDRYFAWRYGRGQVNAGCGPYLPVAEVVRIRARFEQVCQYELALPGSGWTEAELDACTSDAPEACDIRGSLSAGAACAYDFQCQSGHCLSGDPRPSASAFICGTCGSMAAAGQSCAQSEACAQGSVCVNTTPTARNPQSTCLPIFVGGMGAPCDDLSWLCAGELYCDPDASRCSTPAKLGEACLPRPCEWSLDCWGAPAVCRHPGSAGEECGQDCDCAPPLGCFSKPPRVYEDAEGGLWARPQLCNAVTWVAPGGACSTPESRCLIGSCSDQGHGFGPPPPPPPNGESPPGTCPTVIPDRQPCDINDALTTCDTFSECFQGICALHGSVLCQ
jgi:hypothetical protein